MATTVKQFLLTVRKSLEAENIREADRVVEVVEGALRAGLPKEERSALVWMPPAEMSTAWKGVEPIPSEYFERESMYREDGPPETEPLGCPELP